MKRSPRQRGLFPVEALPAPVTVSVRTLPEVTGLSRNQPARLWLCLRLPQLSLDVFAQAGAGPRAVIDQQGRRSRVLICDAAATRQGVRPGLSANAALALLPELQLVQRNPEGEHRLLEQLAGFAMDFTPCVSLASPDALLLEIRGSLSLFGGIEPLREQLVQRFRGQGYAISVAIAPTARAAGWLARTDNPEPVMSHVTLAGCLADLSLACLPWPASWCRTLSEMGVTTLSACVRLPREGLARRLGRNLLAELDEAYGRRPEVLDWYQPPEDFSSKLELVQESADTRQLLAALDVLLEQLAVRLRSLQRKVRRVWLHCEHREHPDTRLCIGLLQATADTGRLRDLGAVQLSGLVLPAAVVAVGLQASIDELLTPQGPDLLATGRQPSEAPLAFIERLRGRLGLQAVHGLQVIAEHRPEYASQVTERLTADLPDETNPVTAQRRPLWMCPSPLELRESAGDPVFRGKLELTCGPERLETGWWDGDDIRRDYYVALNPAGMRLWVYRDLRTTHWYLHGIFG
ncbi:MAG: Y-family DNA polymerase [Gammaproteobacteria bacterium]